MKRNSGIGFGQGHYLTNRKTRARSKNYKDKHDCVTFSLPYGSSDLLKQIEKDWGVKRQDIFQFIAEHYLKEQGELNSSHTD